MNAKIKALTSMGYRPLRSDVWAKPLGTNVIIFHNDQLKIFFNKLGSKAVAGWSCQNVQSSETPDLWVDCLILAEHELISGGIGPQSLPGWNFLTTVENVNFEL